jgi:cytochrome c-type biogenesis protein CcmF
MSSIGTFLLLAAFVTASGAFSASIAGARRNRTALVEGGIGLFHMVTALMLAASAIIVHAFVTGDYGIKYVQHYSNSAQPLFYKLASYWGGLDGSIMFWVTLLSAFGSVAVLINRARYRVLIPWVIATISVVEMFFLFLMVIHNNPFERFLTTAPADGRGLNPLLQNYYMAIHPPMLYLGFVGMTIPFAFGIAALASGQLDDAWLRAVRRWTMLAWLFLTVGLTLGALWAYEELGWGGYWGWDPVENAGLLPWFTATAFLHSVMVQERRGMLKIWNVSLVIVTFFLTIFGTFMTRSGVVQSVHAFGEDKALAWMFTVFMISALVVSFALVIYRMPLLRARNELDSWASREAAFLVNNWILLFAAFFVLFATMFPTLSEAITGERLTVGAPVFDKWLTPVGLLLLALTGIGPLLAWRKSTISNLVQQFVWPVAGAVLMTGGTMAMGFPFWAEALCFGICAFVTVTIAQEFIRGSSVRQRATGTDRFTALVGLFSRSRRRYGGYIVHLGIVLVFLGFAGNGFERHETVTMKPGQRFELKPYAVTYTGLTVTQDAQKQMITGQVDAFRGTKAIGSMYPARWYFFGHEDEPTTEIALRRSLADDLYVVLAGYDVGTQEASIVVHVNPLVNWIWMGVGVIIIGTGIAFLPESAMAFALSRVPAGAATTTTLALLLALGLSGTTLRAQHMGQPDQTIVVAPTSALEKQLQGEIVCMCGGCGRQRLNECNACSTSAAMRQELHELVAQGLSHDAIIAHFIKEYGSQEVLSAPIDTGFNRLLWLFPYALGFVGVVSVGGMAVNWSRRRAKTPDAPAAHATTFDPGLQERLDDELRDLD